MPDTSPTVRAPWPRAFNTPLVMLSGALLALLVFKLLSRFGY